MTDSQSTNKPPKLNSIHDYNDWKVNFESFICFNDFDLWESITIGPNVVSTVNNHGETIQVTDFSVMNTADKILYRRDVKALSALRMSLSKDILYSVMKYTTAFDLWKALKAKFEGNDDLKEIRKDRLKMLFESFKFQSGETLTETVSRFIILINDIRSTNLIISDSDINKKLLNALPKMWHVSVQILKRSSGFKDMTLEDLIAQLQSFEVDMISNDILPNQSTVYSSSGCALIAPSLDENLLTQSSNQSFSNQPSKTSKPKVNLNSSKASDSTLNSFYSDVDQVNSLFATNVVKEDLNQINSDDLEEMDLNWQMAMLGIRTNRYFGRTGKKIWNKSNRNVGFDMSKVQCFRCKQYGHFARECRNENQGSNLNRNQSNQNESNAQTAFAAQYESFDWSALAEDCYAETVHQTKEINYALISEIEEKASLPQHIQDDLCTDRCVKRYLLVSKANEDFLQQIKSLSNEVDENKIDELLFKERIGELMKEVNELVSSKAQYLAQIDDLKRRNEDQSDLAKANDEINRLNNANQDAQDIINSLKVEKENHIAQIHQLTEDLIQSNNDLVEANLDIDKLLDINKYASLKNESMKKMKNSEAYSDYPPFNHFSSPVPNKVTDAYCPEKCSNGLGFAKVKKEGIFKNDMGSEEVSDQTQNSNIFTSSEESDQTQSGIAKPASANKKKSRSRKKKSVKKTEAEKACNSSADVIFKGMNFEHLNLINDKDVQNNKDQHKVVKSIGKSNSVQKQNFKKKQEFSNTKAKIVKHNHKHNEKSVNDCKFSTSDCSKSSKKIKKFYWCYICDVLGHHTADCWYNPRNQEFQFSYKRNNHIDNHKKHNAQSYFDFSVKSKTVSTKSVSKPKKVKQVWIVKKTETVLNKKSDEPKNYDYQEVKYFDEKGRPKVTMAWVPTSN